MQRRVSDGCRLSGRGAPRGVGGQRTLLEAPSKMAPRIRKETPTPEKMQITHFGVRMGCHALRVCW